MRTALPILLLVSFITSCGDDSCSDCTDAAQDASEDVPADTLRVDAGVDAGPASCPPGEPSPEAWDCAADPGIALGEPILAPPMTWTWIAFDEALCMDGSSTGIGVNLNPDSSDVLILLEGGGACFDTLSCFGAANPDGYDATNLARDNLSVLSRGILSRTDDTNPVADWNIIYVPYCSGDLHGGTREDGPEGRRHLGYRNFSAFLSRIVPTFPTAERVLLTGRSAGGLGTVVNYPQTASAFGCVPVHVLNDAGALIPDEYLDPCVQRKVREAWDLEDLAGCELCNCDDGGGLWNSLPFLARRYPDRRFGLATAMEDTTMRTMYGYGYSRRCNLPTQMPAEDFSAGLLATRALTSTDDNFRTYYVPGETHTFTYGRLSATVVESTPLATWLGQMLDGDTAWVDIGP